MAGKPSSLLVDAQAGEHGGAGRISAPADSWQTIMIHFRCWKCHRKYQKPDSKIGTKFLCACQYELRVPNRDGGNCRVRTILDRLIEAVLCGGGCALLGFIASFLILSRSLLYTWPVLVGVTLVCGLCGVLGGEFALDAIGNWMRSQERD